MTGSDPVWTIHGSNILDMLRRVEAGEDPDLVYAEEYANAEHDLSEMDDDEPE
jgi:hypothetical protein